MLELRDEEDGAEGAEEPVLGVFFGGDVEGY